MPAPTRRSSSIVMRRSVSRLTLSDFTVFLLTMDTSRSASVYKTATERRLQGVAAVSRGRGDAAARIGGQDAAGREAQLLDRHVTKGFPIELERLHRLFGHHGRSLLFVRTFTNRKRGMHWMLRFRRVLSIRGRGMNRSFQLLEAGGEMAQNLRRESHAQTLYIVAPLTDAGQHGGDVLEMRGGKDAPRH